MSLAYHIKQRVLEQTPWGCRFWCRHISNDPLLNTVFEAPGYFTPPNKKHLTSSIDLRAREFGFKGILAEGIVRGGVCGSIQRHGRSFEVLRTSLEGKKELRLTPPNGR